jgi:hypothetical protein
MDLTATYTVTLPGDTGPRTIAPMVKRRTRADGEKLTTITGLAPLLATHINAITDDGDRLHVLTLLDRARIVLSDRGDPGWEQSPPFGVAIGEQGRIRIQYQDNALLPVAVLLDLAVRLRDEVAPKMVDEVDFLAESAHAGQTDKIGAPYIQHVRAVAAGLVPFGDELVMAGLLHDVIEDTDWTADRLRAVGVPDRVVAIVEAVTKRPGFSYNEMIWRITENREATLVKIADNAHNSHPDRAALLPEGGRIRMATRYLAARDVLWAAADADDVEKIITIVNPHLLGELRERAVKLTIE